MIERRNVELLIAIKNTPKPKWSTSYHLFKHAVFMILRVDIGIEDCSSSVTASLVVNRKIHELINSVFKDQDNVTDKEISTFTSKLTAMYNDSVKEHQEIENSIIETVEKASRFDAALKQYLSKDEIAKIKQASLAAVCKVIKEEGLTTKFKKGEKE